MIKHRANRYGTTPTLLTHVHPTCLHRLLEIASFPCSKAAEEATKLLLDQSERSRKARNTHAGDRRGTLSGVLLRSLWSGSHPSSYH